MTKEFHELYEAVRQRCEENVPPAPGVRLSEEDIAAIEEQIRQYLPEDAYTLLDDLFTAIYIRDMLVAEQKFRLGLRCGAGLLPATRRRAICGTRGAALPVRRNGWRHRR